MDEANQKELAEELAKEIQALGMPEEIDSALLLDALASCNLELVRNKPMQNPAANAFMLEIVDSFSKLYKEQK